MARQMRKVESEAMRKRIAEVMLDDPTLTNGQLVERFGCSRSVIQKIRKKVNVEKPDDFELIKRKDADVAARKLGLMDTREICRAKMKAQTNYRIQKMMRDREQGNDYCDSD